jgi:WD40 repeat protein
VHFVALSRDGAWAASSGYIGTASPTPGAPGFIKAYDIASGTSFQLLNPSDQGSMVAISNDGTYLAVASDQLYLFKRSGSGATATWSSQSLGFADILRSVAISGDGKWIVAGISRGQVALVQNNGGTLGASTVYDMPVKSFPDRFWALGVAVSGNGNAFAVAGEDATLYFFDIPGNWPGTLTEAWSELLPNSAACRSVSLADDASRVAVVASEGGIGTHTGKGLLFVFDKTHATGTPKWAPSSTKHGPNCVSMDKNGDYVAAADGTPKGGASGTFYLFDAAAGAAGWSPGTNKMNYPIQIAADGKFAVGGCDDGHVYYFTVP